MSVELERGPVFPARPDIASRGRELHRSAPVAPVVNSAPHKLNSVFGVLLVAVVAIAPLPLASNRPAFWTLWAIAIGAFAAIYGIALLWLRAPARRSMMTYWPEAILFIAVLAWLSFQMLPIGQWLPAALTHVPVLDIAANSISLDPGSTRLTLLNFATYGLLFLLFAQVAANRRRARSMLLALFFVIAAFAVYGLVSLVQLGDTLLGFEKLYYNGNATGTFINRNSFATFLAAGLAIGVPLLVESVGQLRGIGQVGRWLRLALVLLGLLFIAATLFATSSRMGAIAGFVGALIGLGLSLQRVEGQGRLWLGLGAVVAVIAVAALYGVGTLERLMLSDDETGRVELYRQVWGAIWQRPWAGYGGGSFATVFPMFQHAPLPGDTLWDKAHSTYLALWFELGLVAGTFPMLVVAGLLFRAVRGLWDASSRVISAAAIAVTVVFALHSLVDFSAEIMADAFLFTAILALGAAGGRTGEH